MIRNDLAGCRMDAQRELRHGDPQRREPGDSRTGEQPEGNKDLQNADHGRRHPGQNQARHTARDWVQCVEQVTEIEVQVLGRVLPDGRQQRELPPPPTASASGTCGNQRSVRSRWDHPDRDVGCVSATLRSSPPLYRPQAMMPGGRESDAPAHPIMPGEGRVSASKCRRTKTRMVGTSLSKTVLAISRRVSQSFCRLI